MSSSLRQRQGLDYAFQTGAVLDTSAQDEIIAQLLERFPSPPSNSEYVTRVLFLEAIWRITQRIEGFDTLQEV